MKRKLQKVDFTGKEIIIGLDVHTKSWYATIIRDEVMERKTFTADAEKLANYLKKNYPNANYFAGYEAGCFGFWIKEKLDKYGIKTIVINAADIPTSDKDKRTKTDKIDSKKIALSMRSGLVKGIYAPSREAQEDRSMVRRRKDIANKTTRIKNQIKAILKTYGISYPEEYEKLQTHWSKKFIRWLRSIEFIRASLNYAMETMINELEYFNKVKLEVVKKMKELSNEKKYQRQSKIIKSVPGFALIGSMTYLTEIVDIKRFKNSDNYTSYIGLTPNEHSSGEKQKKGHMTKRANHRLRTIFIEAAWIAIRKDPALGFYYSEQVKRMEKPKAIIKVAKKLALRIRFLLINNQEYVFGVVK